MSLVVSAAAAAAALKSAVTTPVIDLTVRRRAVAYNSFCSVCSCKSSMASSEYAPAKRLVDSFIRVGKRLKIETCRLLPNHIQVEYSLDEEYCFVTKVSICTDLSFPLPPPDPFLLLLSSFGILTHTIHALVLHDHYIYEGNLS